MRGIFNEDWANNDAQLYLCQIRNAEPVKQIQGIILTRQSIWLVLILLDNFFR